MAIIVHQCEVKSQYHQILKSQNLAKFLRQETKFLHVSSKFIPWQHAYSNMGSH